MRDRKEKKEEREFSRVDTPCELSTTRQRFYKSIEELVRVPPCSPTALKRGRVSKRRTALTLIVATGGPSSSSSSLYRPPRICGVENEAKNEGRRKVAEREGGKEIA
eukprot:2842459-Rhodomonas_salina.1